MERFSSANATVWATGKGFTVWRPYNDINHRLTVEQPNGSFQTFKLPWQLGCAVKTTPESQHAVFWNRTTPRGNLRFCFVDPANGQVARTIDTHTGVKWDDYAPVQMSPDQQTLMVRDKHGIKSVHLIDAQTGSQLWKLNNRFCWETKRFGNAKYSSAGDKVFVNNEIRHAWTGQKLPY